MKDRLIELLLQKMFGDQFKNTALQQAENLADHLLANGVIVPPVSLGQTVWCIYNYEKPKEFQVAILTMAEKHYSFTIETKGGVCKHYCDEDAVGKWVFFTKEEAEKALAERSKK